MVVAEPEEWREAGALKRQVQAFTNRFLRGVLTSATVLDFLPAHASSPFTAGVPPECAWEAAFSLEA